MEALSMRGAVPLDVRLVDLIILSALAINVSCEIKFDRRNQNLTDITTETIPPGTNIARFGFNLLTVVPANYFPADPAFTRLHIDHNDLSTIHDFAFSNLQNLTALKLQHNLLKVIKTDMLKGLFGLRQLFLDHNLVHTVEILAFSDLAKLEKCFLHANRLKSLPQSAFDQNNLPVALNTMNIRSSDLECDCEMVWLKKCDGTWITVASNLPTLCMGPAELAGRKWQNVTLQEMETHGKRLGLNHLKLHGGKGRGMPQQDFHNILGVGSWL